MRLVAISPLALATLPGCVSLHVKVPEEVVRRHVAREEAIELAAICSFEGRSFSEGMAGRGVCPGWRREKIMNDHARLSDARIPAESTGRRRKWR